MENEDSFSITIPKHNVEIFDQGKGMFYIFSLKCFNRARLPRLVTSENFQVYKRVAPSRGVLIHTDPSDPTGSEIGFQENTNTLCLKWFGFTHPSKNITYAVSVGTSPKWDNTMAFLDIPDFGWYCVTDLTLNRNHMYYITLNATAGEDFILESSKGIYIAKEEDLIEDGMVNVGGFCPDVFKHVIYSNISTEENAEFHTNNEYQSVVNLSKESIPYVTLRLTFETMDINIKDNITVLHENEQMEIASWAVRGKQIYLYYCFVQLHEQFHLSVTHEGSNLIEAALHHCSIRSNILITNDVLALQWSVSYPHMLWLTHSHVYLSNYDEFAQQNNSSYEMWNVGKHTDIDIPVHLAQGVSYKLCVNPCFHTTCTSRQMCELITKDSDAPRTGSIDAQLAAKDNGIRDTQFYRIRALWEPFTNYGKHGMTKVYIYDWTISQEENGSGQILQWSRVQFNETNELLLVR